MKVQRVIAWAALFGVAGVAAHAPAAPFTVQAQETLTPTGPQVDRSADASCTLLPAPRAFNQAVVGEVIVIGRLADRPYWVIIPGNDAATLTAVRACATDAFSSGSRLGDYLQVGAFARRSEAEQIARAFRRSGLPARVVYGGSWLR
jgi:hypothetical protein